jgi:hypothetical protein
MNVPAKKVMISFRPKPGDSEAIAKLVLKFGGVSESEAIRIAINEAVNGAKRPAICPQMPPINDVVQVVAAIKKAIRMFETNRNNFWPQHIAGETEQRTAAVKKARQDSNAALDELRPQLDSIRGLLAVLNEAKELNVGGLKAVQAAAIQLEKSLDTFLTRSRDMHQPEKARRDAEMTHKIYAPLVEFLSRAGLLGLRKLQI